MDGLKWKTPIEMNDLGIPLFLETPMWSNEEKCMFLMSSGWVHEEPGCGMRVCTMYTCSIWCRFGYLAVDSVPQKRLLCKLLIATMQRTKSKALQKHLQLKHRNWVTILTIHDTNCTETTPEKIKYCSTK